MQVNELSFTEDKFLKNSFEELNRVFRYIRVSLHTIMYEIISVCTMYCKINADNSVN